MDAVDASLPLSIASLFWSVYAGRLPALALWLPCIPRWKPVFTLSVSSNCIIIGFRLPCGRQRTRLGWVYRLAYSLSTSTPTPLVRCSGPVSSVPSVRQFVLRGFPEQFVTDSKRHK
jgi:hypothetical protein